MKQKNNTSNPETTDETTREKTDRYVEEATMKATKKEEEGKAPTQVINVNIDNSPSENVEDTIPESEDDDEPMEVAGHEMKIGKTLNSIELKILEQIDSELSAEFDTDWNTIAKLMSLYDTLLCGEPSCVLCED